jgi:hypothetical protein
LVLGDARQVSGCFACPTGHPDPPFGHLQVQLLCVTPVAMSRGSGTVQSLRFCAGCRWKPPSAPLSTSPGALPSGAATHHLRCDVLVAVFCKTTPNARQEYSNLRAASIPKLSLAPQRHRYAATQSHDHIPCAARAMSLSSVPTPWRARSARKPRRRRPMASPPTLPAPPCHHSQTSSAMLVIPRGGYLAPSVHEAAQVHGSIARVGHSPEGES